MAGAKEPWAIAVCIPTYKRPLLLGKCLDSLCSQECRGFTYSLTVVDNDLAQSARDTVESRRGSCPVELRYEVEPERSISLARNRAIRSSEGQLIAFIDDDERAEPGWLLSLFGCVVRYSADGVLGPVLPHFEDAPPKWLVRSGLCDRESFQTGTLLSNPRHMRTGNALFGRHILAGLDAPFDPRFGLSGGEDTDFFSRLSRDGRSFVWCNEAAVHETVPPERQKRSFYIRRALVRGVNTAKREPFFSLRTILSVCAVAAYTLMLPFLLAAGQHLFMKYLVKDCEHTAKLLARFGILLARERSC